ncbi:hypothetical protein UA32_12155 [Photobacterium angustum]|uniref:Uncharacterized protein n=1 Tax=Photobacterium angustum TaxID=661 RepID=A0ABX5GZD4_PHOAN|nr:hypothetical protein [Photobacterium angustum]KJG37708.1 hypothetical protein UA32_12155 [Photobacterium angustum]PSX03960.1 hypothetical protein C0W27_20925 [Photobacterium angustum]
MVSIICLKSLSKLLIPLSFFISEPSGAWSQSSYEIILANAERKEKLVYDRVKATVNGKEVRLFTYYKDTSSDVKNAFARYSRKVPDGLRKEGFYFDKSAFVLRKGGFEQRDTGQLSANYKAIEDALAVEQNSELKLRLMALLTKLRVSAYFPSNIVTFRDSRAFFKTDRYGYDYCLGFPRRKLSHCGSRNLHQYTANLLSFENKPLPEVKQGHLFRSIDDVIVATANEAVNLYRIQPGVRLSDIYQQSTLETLESQASMAVSDVITLWRKYYPNEVN